MVPTPPDNETLAALFAEASDLLELTGDNPHRVRSYASVARILEGLPRPAAAMLADGTLTDVKGIGEGTAARVRELVETGRLGLLEEPARPCRRGSARCSRSRASARSASARSGSSSA